MVIKESITSDEIKIKKSEVLRYLGYRKDFGAEDINSTIDFCIEEVKKSLSAKICFDVFPILKSDDTSIDFGVFKIKSKSLLKNLDDCNQAIVFTATIGHEVDRLIKRYLKTSPSVGVILGAVATCTIENWCDVFLKKLKDSNNFKNKFFRPRFSPGYGDVPLEVQSDIFKILDCPKNIGVTLTDALLMTPTKSVSAIVGVSDKNSDCHKNGCKDCNKLNCDYRRN